MEQAIDNLNELIKCLFEGKLDDVQFSDKLKQLGAVELIGNLSELMKRRLHGKLDQSQFMDELKQFGFEDDVEGLIEDRIENEIGLRELQWEEEIERYIDEEVAAKELQEWVVDDYIELHKDDHEEIDEDGTITSFYGNTITISDITEMVTTEQLVKCAIGKENVKLIEEIKERFTKLHENGVCDTFIEILLKKDEPISRLVVTKDYRIVLPDYDNMQIEMTPLSKAVFLLFLNHPEGISFKELSNHKSELKDIYKKVKGSENNTTIDKTIDAVINPTKNTMNEVRSRINKAFTEKLEKSVVNEYVINGDKANVKRIILPREKVENKGI